jgi:hypothetical protein
MPWDIGARRVDHVREVHLSCEKLLDQLLAKLALHERVGRDLANIAGTTSIVARLAGQLEKPLRERDRKSVLPVTRGI